MTTKRILICTVAIILMCTFVISLSSCSTDALSGTYVATEGLIKQSITFMSDGNVSMSVNGIGVNVTGKYKIEGDMITVTYKLLNISYDWEKSFEKKGNRIFIDGTEYVKQK